MKKISNFSLKQTNSFGVESISPIAYFPHCIDDLIELANLQLSSFYILGEGFNTLFIEDKSPVIIKPEFTGIEINNHLDHTIVKASASENWHHFVSVCVEKNIKGLENLALIPGSVGAAPVQNIGAYGAEFSQYCQSVLWFDFESKKCVNYTKEQCLFSYRESIFKNQLKNKGIILSVTFCFPKKWKANLSYTGLEHLPLSVSSKQVMQEVINIRQAKLPDPIRLPNAGSFFKNPVLNYSQWQKLIKKYPNMPSYPQDNSPYSNVKVAAGWLIEHAGLKGYKNNSAGVHEKQALVIVNYGSPSGKNVADLALTVKNKVKSIFDITLEPEVRAVFSQGEGDLITGLVNQHVENKNG